MEFIFVLTIMGIHVRICIFGMVCTELFSINYWKENRTMTREETFFKVLPILFGMSLYIHVYIHIYKQIKKEKKNII